MGIDDSFTKFVNLTERRILMRYLIATLLVLLSLAIAKPIIAAPDAKPATPKVEAMKKAVDASVKQHDSSLEPAKPDPIGDAKPPKDIKEGIKQVETLWGAIQAKAWWLVAAAGVFIAMLLLQLLGLFKKMGKRWTWIVAGVLSFAAALFLAFDKSGFSWSSFVGFCTAGPTVAWLRGFIKKAVLNFQKEEAKKEEG